jgi:lipopolysaccharide biosynthesis glycosyltransferase
MQIAFASDDRYFDGLALAVASVLKYTTCPPGSCIHVLDGGLSEAHRRGLEDWMRQWGHGVDLRFHTVNTDLLKGVRVLQGSPLTYARLLLPDLFPDLNEIIYGDVDVWYGADLRPLWAAADQGRAAVVVRDTVIPTLESDGPWLAPDAEDRHLPYFNAGVMKINLAYWREKRVGPAALEIAQAEPDKCKCWDQTILNHLLRHQLVWLDGGMNYLASDDNPVDRGIESCEGKNIHYICRVKPWMRYSKRVTFSHWREEYQALVSARPSYLFYWRFWMEYLWADWIVAGPLIKPISRFLLTTRLYRILPGLSMEKLDAHLRTPGTSLK